MAPARWFPLAVGPPAAGLPSVGQPSAGPRVGLPPLGARAAPAADPRSLLGQRRQSERRLHNHYSIRTDRLCVRETCSSAENRRRSRRRGLRTLKPATRRPASPSSPIETISCAVPFA